MGTTENVLIKLNRPRGYIVVEPSTFAWQAFIGGIYIDGGKAASEHAGFVKGADALRRFERGLRGRVRSRRA